VARSRHNFQVRVWIDERQSVDRTARRMKTRYRQVLAGRQELIRQLADDLRDTMAEEAPKDSGAFAEGLRVRREVSDAWGMSQFLIRSTGEHATVGKRKIPLWRLIARGTQPHIIPRGGSARQLAKGYPLSFFWENGPHGPGLYHYWSVNHPGTAPNPFADRAIDRWRPGAQRQLREWGVRVGSASMTVY